MKVVGGWDEQGLGVENFNSEECRGGDSSVGGHNFFTQNGRI